MVTFYRNILQLILAPTKAWEDISAEKSRPAELALNCMYPLFAVAGLSVFVQGIYHDGESWANLTIRSAAIFVAFFVTYIICWHVFRMFFDRYVDGEINYRKCGILLVYSLSLLALSMVVCNMFPLSMGLPYLLPVAVGMIIWKSSRYLGVPRDREARFGLFLFMTVILPPNLIIMMFDWVLR